MARLLRLARRLAPFLPVALFAVALGFLHRELAGHAIHEVLAYVRELPLPRLALAALATAASYLVLTGYDALGVRTAGARLPYPRVALVSFVGYSFSNAIGHAMLTSTPLRFRLYGAWGVAAERVARIVAFAFLTFWLGFLGLFGAVLAITPAALPPTVPLGGGTWRALGIVLLATVGAYLAALAVRGGGTIHIRGWEIPVPRLRVGVAQLAISAADWGLAAAVLYVLLPEGAGISYPGFLAVFLVGNAAGILSAVPGGIGVFETVVVVALAPVAAEPRVLGALLLFRLVYYVAPLTLAALLLAVLEGWRQRRHLARVAGLAAGALSAVAPPIFAATVFVGGAILLATGATPAHASRIAWLGELLPLPVIEGAHFLGSLAGTALLVLSRGLHRRLDTAYHLTVALLAGGLVLSLLRGLDWITAGTLGVMLVTLAPLSSAFPRQARLRDVRMHARWALPVLVVLVGTVWLTLFSYRHVAYSQDLWWSFALRADAPRSLRALVGATVVLVAVALWQLLGPARPKPQLPGAEEIGRAAAIAARAPRTYSWLAVLGDKQLLFSGPGDAFVMYGVSGRSWVALGDPVGADLEADELAWAFRDLAVDEGGWPVFYQVSDRGLARYVDLGLALVKLGEEAIVPLADFDLLGPARKKLRTEWRRGQREGLSLEIAPPEDVPGLLPDLAAISERWLRDKGAAEKGFSLGTFSEAYLRRFPIAVVRREGRPLAFANLLAGVGREELSIDLMRHLPEAPPGLMTFLFVELMRWGASEGYASFSLGMAPLAGLAPRHGGRLWNRVGHLVFRHGEHFYNFQGLRAFKEKFDPVWEPRYLASPGGIALPRVLANVTTLIAGGVSRLVTR